MRILYGIQGTGLGHLSRSLDLVVALRARGHEVDVLVSGRPPAMLRLAEGVSAVTVRKGLTFVNRGGRIRYLETAWQLDFGTLARDVRALCSDASRFDLVVTDFEPITAWMARRADLPCVGVANQYAFRFRVPMAGGDPLGRLILAGFAPVACPLGLHWHHWGAPIFPPIVARDLARPAPFAETRVLVYLPYEDRDTVVRVLRRIRGFEFELYTNIPAPVDRGNVRLRPLDREEILWDLSGCAGVPLQRGLRALERGAAPGEAADGGPRAPSHRAGVECDGAGGAGPCHRIETARRGGAPRVARAARGIATVETTLAGRRGHDRGSRHGRALGRARGGDTERLGGGGPAAGAMTGTASAGRKCAASPLDVGRMRRCVVRHVREARL